MTIREILTQLAEAILYEAERAPCRIGRHKWNTEVDKDNRLLHGHCVVCGKVAGERY